MSRIMREGKEFVSSQPRKKFSPGAPFENRRGAESLKLNLDHLQNLPEKSREDVSHAAHELHSHLEMMRDRITYLDPKLSKDVRAIQASKGFRGPYAELHLRDSRRAAELAENFREVATKHLNESLKDVESGKITHEEYERTVNAMKGVHSTLHDRRDEILTRLEHLDQAAQADERAYGPTKDKEVISGVDTLRQISRDIEQKDSLRFGDIEEVIAGHEQEAKRRKPILGKVLDFLHIRGKEDVKA